MSGTVLVVEGETPLGRQLARQFSQSGWRVVVTHRKSDRPEATDDGAGHLRIPWGKASPVSARNVMLKILTTHDKLDLALFPLTPALKRVLLHETEYAEIESAIDEWVRGTLFLLREVLAQLVRQGSGRLALVQSGGRDVGSVHPPLEGMVRGALNGLSASLVASYGGEGVRVSRFETEEPDLEGYAGYIAGVLASARSGKPGGVYRYRSRPGLLERLGLRKG